MKTVQIVPSLNAGGGAEQVASDVAAGLAERGHDSTLMSLYRAESGNVLREYLGTSGVRLLELGKRKGPSLGVLFRVRQEIAKLNPDVVHSHLSGLHYSSLVSRRSFHKAFHTIHNDPQYEVPRYFRFVNRALFDRGRVPVILSDLFAPSLEHAYGMRHYEVVANGVRGGSGSQPRETNGLSRTSIQLVSVTRLARQKRQDVLLRAMQLLLVRGSLNIRLSIVGDGPERTSLESLARELGIESRVCFVGLVDDVSRWLANADIFVLPSDYEGMPLSVVEALFVGLPIVACRVGAVPDLVVDGRNGLLVDSGNPRALEQAILRLAVSPDLRDAYGRESLAMSTAFGIDSMVDRYEQLYRRYLEPVQDGSV